MPMSAVNSFKSSSPNASLLSFAYTSR
jgi:hypothetical protein